MAGQANYKQLAEEIGEVLQAAAETADKMQDEARIVADRIRAEAETERRTAYADGRRILDEARMEADMVRAEAEWQAQEIIAHARRQATERMAGIDARLGEMAQAENRVMDRLAGVGQILADALAVLRERPPLPAPYEPPVVTMDDIEDDADHPSAKVYFVEFPPAPVQPGAGPAPARADAHVDISEPETEIVLTDCPDASLFHSEQERSEWAPPTDMPTWWTRDGAQG